MFGFFFWFPAVVVTVILMILISRILYFWASLCTKAKAAYFRPDKLTFHLKREYLYSLGSDGRSFVHSVLSPQSIWNWFFFAFNWCRVFFGSSDILRDESKVANIFSLNDALGFGHSKPKYLFRHIKSQKQKIEIRYVYLWLSFFRLCEYVLMFQVYGRRSHINTTRPKLSE